MNSHLFEGVVLINSNGDLEIGTENQSGGVTSPPSMGTCAGVFGANFLFIPIIACLIKDFIGIHMFAKMCKCVKNVNVMPARMAGNLVILAFEICDNYFNILKYKDI